MTFLSIYANQIIMGNALISVSDKRNLLELCQALNQHGFSIYATPGTSKGQVVEAKKSLWEEKWHQEFVGIGVKEVVYGFCVGLKDGPSFIKNCLYYRLKGGETLGFKKINKNIDKNIDILIIVPERPHDIGGLNLIYFGLKNNSVVVTDPSDYSILIDSLEHKSLFEKIKRELLDRSINRFSLWMRQMTEEINKLL